MKQTAVEFLEEVYQRDGYITAEEFKQAKAMFKQQMIEFGYACTKQIEMNEAGELLMVKSPEELYTQVYGGEMNMGETTMTTTMNTNPGTTMRQQVQIYINTINAFGEELSDVETDTLYDFAGWVDSIDEFYGS